MAKRFTDTETWNDPWYRKMPTEAKVLWRFLLDRCDVAGFWKKDYEMASFQCGFEVSDELLKHLNNGKGRVKDHGGYLEVVDFVSFQYGELKPSIKPHMPVIRLQQVYKNKGYLKGINTLEDKEQDKDKEQEQDKGKGSDKLTHSIDYLKKVPEADLTELSEKYVIAPKGIKSKAYDLELYCEQKGKKYKNYKAFLENALRKDKQDLQNKFPYVKKVEAPPPEEELTEEQKRKNEELKVKIREIASKKSSLTI